MIRFLYLVLFIFLAVIGVDFAFAANANLFVSAENSLFNNYMSGPQVIEVVVTDMDIDETDEAKGEPDVSVNGKILRMIQAVDGNWYGYFADNTQAQIADSTAAVDGPDGEGLDFGTFCGKNSTILSGEIPVSVSDTEGIAVNAQIGIDGTNPPTDPLVDCAIAAPVFAYNNFPADGSMNVLRETKNINTNSPTSYGQIGLDTEAWPFIQLYNLSVGGNVVVQYNKGGGAQTTTLTFDTAEGFANLELDKLSYGNGENILVTITDLWLNIDPTSNDSWTFSTNDGSPHYQVFNNNGLAPGDTASNTDSDVGDVLVDFMCNDNCRLLINPNFNGAIVDVITIQDNSDSQMITVTAGDPQDPLDQATAAGYLAMTVPVTITELGPNSGVFGSFDESNTSNIVITNDASDSSTASVDYNETPKFIMVVLPPPPACQVPLSGQWMVTEDCLLMTSSTTPQNVSVQNNSVLTISSGVTLTISSGQNITIFSGSGVLIKFGGTLELPPPLFANVSIPQGTSVPGCEPNSCFIPFEAMVSVGGQVTWSNDDSAAHTVTSGTPGGGPDGIFDSSLFLAGTTFSHTFTGSGTFDYFCLVHPWMSGKVVVT